MTMNFGVQYYKGIPLILINRPYDHVKAKRFTLNFTNQNVWIPNKHLHEDGTIKDNQDLDYVFFKSKNECYAAGVTFSFVVKDNSHLTHSIDNRGRRHLNLS